MRDIERHGTVRRPQVCHRSPPAALGPAGPEAAAPPVVPGQARSAPSRTAPVLTASPGPGPHRPRHPHGPRRPAASQRPGAAPPCGHRLPGPARPCPATPPRAVSGPAQHRPVPAPLPRPLALAPPRPSARPPPLSRNWCEERWITPQAPPSRRGPRLPASPGMAPLRGEGPDYSISAESPAQPHGSAAGPAPLPAAVCQPGRAAPGPD
ncbi:basic proline-rich protein-like [Molothrus aeneus]|uniref:basic proline-rich protein-like n=1 Tax=Molothrus aeneus TaxID=84833 RepID=UPI0034584121